jgi:2-polyprenyl-3-methyl-5-hydroxy-6-metoxy-1,4-benzoquinol methylase
MAVSPRKNSSLAAGDVSGEQSAALSAGYDAAMTSPAPFVYRSAEGLCSDPYVFPEVIGTLRKALPDGGRVLDIGCGNGSLTGRLAGCGYEMVGVDLSQGGITLARETHPSCRFEVISISERVLSDLGTPPFDAVVSTEVIEHLYDPHELAKGAYTALRPGGIFVLSTPYHGWLKNVAISIAGKFDDHVNPLFTGGHIKFFSRRSLYVLLTQAGFNQLTFRGAGRLPGLWKSMVVAGLRGHEPRTP